MTVSLVCDCESGGAIAVYTAPLVTARAVAGAQRNFHAVVARGKRLGLTGSRVQGEENNICAGCFALVKLAARQRHAGRWNHYDIRATSAGFRINCVIETNVELGACRAACGSNPHVVRDSRAVACDRANFGLVTEEDRIRILVFNEVNERFDSNVVADQIASVGFIFVREIVAKLRTTSDDSNIEDNVEQLIDNLAHDLDTNIAKINFALYVIQFDFGLTLET